LPLIEQLDVSMAFPIPAVNPRLIMFLTYAVVIAGNAGPRLIVGLLCRDAMNRNA
jgi:hypothetical protein